MITIETAKNLVNKQVEKFNQFEKIKAYIFNESTIEKKDYWVFFWGNYDYELSGNGPYIIEKKHGYIFRTGTGGELKFYLKSFEELYKLYPDQPEEINRRMPL